MKKIRFKRLLNRLVREGVNGTCSRDLIPGENRCCVFSNPVPVCSTGHCIEASYVEANLLIFSTLSGCRKRSLSRIDCDERINVVQMKCHRQENEALEHLFAA